MVYMIVFVKSALRRTYMAQAAQLSHTIPAKTRDGIDTFRKSVVDSLGDQVVSMIVYGSVTRDGYYPG